MKQELPTRHDYLSLYPVSVGVVLAFFLFLSLVNCVCHFFYLLFTSVLSFSVDLWFLFMSWYLLTSLDEMNDPDTNTAIQR